MSELRTAKSNAASNQWAASDAHALAQVEKWMAMIREIGSKPRDSWNEPGKEAAGPEL